MESKEVVIMESSEAVIGKGRNIVFFIENFG